MGRARNIKPGFLKNERLAEVHPLGRILFQGLWMICDREGRLEDRPRRIKAECLPYDDCNPDDLLEQLAQREFIIRYGTDTERYIQVVNFLVHQNPHPKEKASVISSREEMQLKGVVLTQPSREKVEPCRVITQTDPAESLNPESLNACKVKTFVQQAPLDMLMDEPPFDSPDLAPKGPRLVKQVEAIPDPTLEKFNQWWAIYWRREARKAALTAFRVHCNTDARFTAIMDATITQTPKMRARLPESRPQGASWLNGERWEDPVSEIPALVPPGGGLVKGGREGMVDQVQRLLSEGFLEGKSW